MNSKKLTVVSLSGGLDSFATTIKALELGSDVYLVNFQYKQKHMIETYCVDKIVDYLRKNYTGKIIGYSKIDFQPILNNFLSIYERLRDTDVIKDITSTKFYTPSRNLLFVSNLVTIGEILAMERRYEEMNIGLGIHKHSESVYRTQYWDITVEFVERLNQLLSLNKNVTIRLFTPFVDQSKDKIIKFLKDRNVPFDITWTCYDPKVSTNGSITIYRPCNECESCKERLEAGMKAGVPDINQYMIVTISEYEDESVFDY